MRVAMIGAGYVGLVSAACFSEFGLTVSCVDSDPERIAALRAGRIPIYEPGLEPLLAANVAAGRLSFTEDIAAAVPAADVVLLAVGTPSRRGDGHADLTHIHEAARQVADALDGYTVVATKSTVPVGTGREIVRIIRERRPDASFDAVSNPEFLREGSAIGDFMRPDRVVVGAESERARSVMRALYRPLFLAETPVLFTALETAELIKYAANCFLATKITFINEIADLCERLGADVQDVARGIGLDGRIGRYFLHAGPGFGGSCFPKDAAAFARIAEEAGAPSGIVEAVLRKNTERKTAMVDKIVRACGGSVAGKTVAVLGVTFKPNTDDVRGEPESGNRAGAHGARGNDPGIRSRRHGGGPAGSRRRRLVPGLLRSDGRRRCAGHPHRVERVQGARPRPCAGAAQDAAYDRSPQHLRAERGGRRRLSLREHWPAGGLSMSAGHALNPAILGAYDIRGIVGETLTGADMAAIGRGFATIAGRRSATGRPPLICVGRDGRLSSPDLEAHLVEGLTAAGADVLRIGVGPTPMLYFAVHERQSDGGMMITGSHNPPAYNGVKMVLGGRPFFGPDIEELAPDRRRRRRLCGRLGQGGGGRSCRAVCRAPSRRGRRGIVHRGVGMPATAPPARCSARSRTVSRVVISC